MTCVPIIGGRSPCCGDGVGLFEVRAAPVANINLATDLEAGDTIDGVTLNAGDPVLVSHQTTRSQNGIYAASPSGAAARYAGWNATEQFLRGRRLVVSEGDYYGDGVFELDTHRPNLGVGNVDFRWVDRGQNTISQVYTEKSEFTTSANVWVIFGAGGGGGFQDVTHGTDGYHVGELCITTGGAGSAAGTRWGYTGGADWYYSTGGSALFESEVFIDDLPTVAEDYELRVGFQDNDIGDATDGWYFQCDRSSGTPFWYGKTANNAVRSVVPLTPATTGWVHLEARQAENGASVSFFVNRVLLGTLTTNIPTARRCRAELQVSKTAGAGVLFFWLDCFQFFKRYAPPK